MRRGDLIALQWSDISDTGIHVRTHKTGKTASIPFVPESRAVLAEIGRRDGHVLLNTAGKPWTASGIEGMIIKAKAKAGVQKRLHDARGTFATRLRIAGYTGPQIADVMGWEEDRVSSLLSVYVDRETVVRQLSPENESATKTPKRTPKRSATPLGK